MSWRALVIGVAASLFIAGAGHVNDRILNLESFTSGHLIPVIVLGSLFLTVVVLNPLLRRLRPDWPLRPAELALIVALTMAACSIPGRGLMEQFTQNLVMPFHWNQVTPGWKEHGLLGYVPIQAFVARTDANHDAVVTRYITGSQQGGLADAVPLLERPRRLWEQVPWEAWWPALATWLPMIFLSALSMCALAVIVHRQWSDHEHLSYPIAECSAALFERQPGEILPSVMGLRLFWVGFAPILLIRLNNGLQCWFPDVLVPVTLSWPMTAIGTAWPAIYKTTWGSLALQLSLFPLVVALAFFLSSEISLTMGISQLLYLLLAIPLVTRGVNLYTDYGVGGFEGDLRAGAYVALTFTMLYSGRQYYRQVLARALAFWRRVEARADVAAVWACRACLVSMAALVVLVTRLGVAWPWAAATVVLMLLGMVMTSRIAAETGLFYISPRWQPFGVLLGMLGGYTLGPVGVVVTALVCTNLCIDQSQALMPYLVNGLKIGEKAGLTPGRLARTTFLLYVAGVVVAVAVTLMASYHFGCTSYQWSRQRIPIMPFQAVEPEVLQMRLTGTLADGEGLPWFHKLSGIHSRPNFWPAAGLGFGLVAAFSALRLRVPWWPLHPVLFLLWATWPMAMTSYSFLAGWFIKGVVMRVGGPRLVVRLKPLMVGVIAAEIMGALVFTLVGGVYFFATGKPPISYVYFPR